MPFNPVELEILAAIANETADTAAYDLENLTAADVEFALGSGLTSSDVQAAIEEVYAGLGGAPAAHAASHKSGGSDVILLNEFGNPVASVQFSQQQALQLRIENRTSDPGTPAVGQIWLRTDL